ncbi:MAG TPA: hypothetical protein VK543_15655 [Puia sp.]|nr:hypothetical protein [Puia sp.]
MRTSLLIVMVLVWPNGMAAQPCAGFEQYFYADRSGLQAVVPIVYFQNKQNWYIESHVNYEGLQTFSTYVGKTFSGNKAFSYSVTPMIGGVVGALKGGVLGFNTELKYKNFFFSSQSQYIFSLENSNVDFMYSWMELGYQVIGPALIGLSIQHTMLNPTNAKLETGLLIRFSVKKWLFPIYCFSPASRDMYLVLGVAREFSFPVKTTNHVPRVNP